MAVRQYTVVPSQLKAWDWSHISQQDGPFKMPVEAEAWHAEAKRHYADEAADLGCYLGNFEGALVSIGCGQGYLELRLERLFSQQIIAMDSDPETIDRLRQVASFMVLCADFREMFSPAAAHVLAFRVDTELSNSEWRSWFKTSASIGVKSIIFVPAQFLTWRLRWQMWRQRKGVKSGWLRTEREMNRLWASSYRLKERFVMGKYSAFHLELL